MADASLSRRQFLRVSFTAGGALLVGVSIAACTDDGKPNANGSSSASGRADGDAFAPNLFVRVDPDGTVTLVVHRTEMGQGVKTALAMIIAEELEVDVTGVRIEQADANAKLPSQLTSGSGSVADHYTALRQAGGGAKQILVAAGAKHFGVAVGECHAESGAVVRTGSGERISYGELVSTARSMQLDGGIVLKDPKDFRVIGTSVSRVDLGAMVAGELAYGLDVRVPGMLFATVARSPVLGGTVSTFDDAPAKAVAGVRDVVKITSGVAVVADNTWAAIQGRAALVVTFEDGLLQAHSTDSIDQAMSDALQRLVATAPPASPAAIEAEYTTPYLAHASMEPLSCVADVRADRCEVWAPTQNPVDTQKFVQDAVGVPTVVHVTMVGGGFGRRLEVDFAVEAAETSKAVGHPVQVMWTREDDIRHDFYRPPTRHWMRADVDASNQLALWRHFVAGPGLNGVIYKVGRDLLLDGLDVSYSIPDNDSNAAIVDVELPTGPWRAVLDGPNAFANECFLDEVATALSRDPFELRMSLLRDSDVMKPVVALVAEKAGWSTPVPAGQGRGIACHQRADTPVAMVAEVSVDAGVVRVHKVVCAIDCGTVVNPDMVVQQMEGGIVYGLTAFLKGQITFDRGRVQQGNFDDYPLLQLAEMPTVEVHVVPSTRPPKGVGEMGVPPIAPAVANALFAITGKRIRHMPVTAADL